MDIEFLRTLDPQILLGVFVALVAIGAGAAYYLSSSKKRRGSIIKSQPFDSPLCVPVSQCVADWVIIILLQKKFMNFVWN